MVKEALKKVGRPFQFKTAHITPMGLFEILREFPDQTIVLDDVTELFRNQIARQILLAALGGKAGEPRHLSYASNKEKKGVDFLGGIIAISNLPLANDPVTNALKSRIAPVEFEPTDEQLAAFAHELSLKPHHDLSYTERRRVTEFIAYESNANASRLDLRHYYKALETYRHGKDGHAQTPWTELVRADLHQRVSTASSVSHDDHEIALAIQAEFPLKSQKAERDKAWIEQTGKSVDSFYRHIRRERGGN